MRALVLAALVAVSLAVPATALADGLPALGVDVGSEGVAAAGSPERYVTINDGEWTIIERVARNGGRVLAWQKILGTFTIPAVAYDSSASGISADGGTLVLIEPRQTFPRAVTTFALLDARKLRLERTFTLRGDFSFDAISPKGGKMFLIHYTEPADPTRYAVRAYDLRAGALMPKPVVDPAEPADKMRGSPITRTLSADGRWAYTLYDGAGGEPFVHALDAATSRAHCVDLPMLAGNQKLWAMRLTRGTGSQLRVESSGEAVATIDTTTFAASLPSVAAPSDLRSWLIAALAAGSLVGVLVATRRRFRGRPAPA